MLGVIAAGDSQTADAGAAMLRMGGNAVDAAVAAAFASFITEVGVVHLGGSGIAQLYIPSNHSDHNPSATYDFFSNMPGLGLILSDVDLDFQKVTIDFGPTTQDFYLGRGSVAVPGNISGLCRLMADAGTMPLKTLLQPAIQLAEEGIKLAPFQADTCQLLEPIYTNTLEMKEIFAGSGRIIQSGERLFIPDLARTLKELANGGINYALEGDLAKRIIADQSQNGGLLTQADLQNYDVMQKPSIRIRYREYDILLPPPSSSGGVLTAFTLSLLNHFDLGNIHYGSTRHLRLLYEVMAATTRARPIWDRSLEELPESEAVAYFLSDSFIKHFVDEVSACLFGNERLPALSESSPHPDTSHLSVIDKDGLAVSLTTTAGETAGFVVPHTGYIPNNILGEEDLHPKGFHTGQPGRRIPTMMTPTIVLKDNNIRLVVGSGGSIRIRSAIMQVLSNLLDHKMKLYDAVNNPRVHLENGILQCELGYDPDAVDKLERSGYQVNRWNQRSIYFGGAHSVSRSSDGRLVGAGDNRRGGAVTVVSS